MFNGVFFKLSMLLKRVPLGLINTAHCRSAKWFIINCMSLARHHEGGMNAMLNVKRLEFQNPSDIIIHVNHRLHLCVASLLHGNSL